MNKEEIFRYHSGQRWGDHPYSLHLENVALVVTSFFKNSDRVVRIAYSHDLLEDTQALPEHVDDDIRESVMLLSRNYSQGDLTYQEYIKFLADSADAEAKAVKLADAIVNYALSKRDGSDLIKRYKRSIPVLWIGVFGEEVDWHRVDDIASVVQFS